MLNAIETANWIAAEVDKAMLSVYGNRRYGCANTENIPDGDQTWAGPIRTYAVHYPGYVLRFSEDGSSVNVIASIQHIKVDRGMWGDKETCTNDEKTFDTSDKSLCDWSKIRKAIIDIGLDIYRRVYIYVGQDNVEVRPEAYYSGSVRNLPNTILSTVVDEEAMECYERAPRKVDDHPYDPGYWGYT